MLQGCATGGSAGRAYVKAISAMKAPTQIPLALEPTDREPCCFCFEKTGHWYTQKDVAVCKKCAKLHTPSEVPSKAAWFTAVEKNKKDRARLNLELMITYRPYLIKFPDTQFMELLRGRYGVMRLHF